MDNFEPITPDPGDLAKQGFPEIRTTLVINLLIGVALYVLFEVTKNKKSVHGRRLDRTRHRAPPPFPKRVLGWLSPTLRLTGNDVLELAGLDAHLHLRFTWLCLRICLFGTVGGMLVLAPLYNSGGGSADGFYKLTLANVPAGDSMLWAAVVFAYLFTAHALWLLDQEYVEFCELRQQFLCYGDPDLVPQSRYSIMVEYLPSELRSGVALAAYYDALFPGEVHSAVICQDLNKLESLVQRRSKTVHKLERARARRMAAEAVLAEQLEKQRKQRAAVAASGGSAEYCSSSSSNSACCGCGADSSDLIDREQDRVEAEAAEERKLTQLLAEMNEEVVKEQKAALAAAEQLNTRDEELLSALKRRAMRGLRSLGELLGSGRLGPARTDSPPDSHSRSHSSGSGVGAAAAAATAGTPADSSSSTSGSGSSGDGSAAAAAVNTLPEPQAHVQQQQRRASNDTQLDSTLLAVEEGEGNDSDSEPDSSTTGTAASYQQGAAAGATGSGTAAGSEKRHHWHRRSRNAPAEGGFTSSGSNAAADRDMGSQSVRDRLAAAATHKASPVTAVLQLLTAAASALHTGVRTAVGLAVTSAEAEGSTGFVTFTTLAATAAASQVLVTHRSRQCRARPAPEPRDIVWQNVPVPASLVSLRGAVANAALALGALLWSVPLAAIQALTSIEELQRYLPFLRNLDRTSVWYSLIAGYLPVLALLGLINLLPLFFQAIAQNYEKRKSKSEIQQSIMSRFFYYQFANIWITVTAGSIFESFESIIDRPKEIVDILGKTFPSVAVYFLNLVLVKVSLLASDTLMLYNLVLVKALSGLPLELCRIWPLLTIWWSQKCGAKNGCTLWSCLCCCSCCRGQARRRRKRTRGAMSRGAFTPPSLAYGWVYPTLLLVLVVCLVYAAITPLMLPVGTMFFLGTYVVHKFQILYVYVPLFESGGSFWFDVHDWTLVGLIISQLTLIGYVALRGGFRQSPTLLPLLFIVAWYRHTSADKYKEPSQRLSLERARQLDERLSAQYPQHTGAKGPAAAVYNFSPTAYTPPALVAGPAQPEPLYDSSSIAAADECSDDDEHVTAGGGGAHNSSGLSSSGRSSCSSSSTASSRLEEGNSSDGGKATPLLPSHYHRKHGSTD